MIGVDAMCLEIENSAGRVGFLANFSSSPDVKSPSIKSSHLKLETRIALLSTADLNKHFEAR